jgi:hypothetical protein
MLLLLDARMAPFHAVMVDAVSVAGEDLNIPSEVWDIRKDGGAILDSGTSLTILATSGVRCGGGHAEKAAGRSAVREHGPIRIML